MFLVFTKKLYRKALIEPAPTIHAVVQGKPSIEQV
jgi:hypothetical protein